MSKFKCSFRLVEKFAEMGSTSHAWIALHRCVEAFSSTKGQSFQATFEVLEAIFTFERKNNSLDIQTILRCASFFILINEQKLKSHFEKMADYEMLSAIEKKEWQEVIYLHNNRAYNQKIDGFKNVHPTAYNRVQSLTFSILINENRTDFGFKKYDSGFYLEKPLSLGSFL